MIISNDDLVFIGAISASSIIAFLAVFGPDIIDWFKKA